MARFNMELPTEIIKDMQKINDNAEDIFGKMTKAGAQEVAKTVKATVPNKELAGHVEVSVTYKTPSDGGINTKVYFKGYIPFKGNRKTFQRRGAGGGTVYTTTKGVPAAFLAQLYEYGRSTAPFPHRPFFRKAFNKKKIEAAMLDAQKKASGGILS